ncbi:5171_t:CDS:2, partial [Cetraspora pellucida]
SLIELNSGISTPLESTLSESETNCDLTYKKVKRGGPTFDEVWDYVVKGEKKELGYSEQEYKELISQFCYFNTKKTPFDLPYIQELDTSQLWWSSIKNRSYHLSELLTELELCKIIRFVTIDDYINDSLDNYIVNEKETSKNCDIFNEDLGLLTQNSLILDDIVNLWNLVFQEKETLSFELSINAVNTSVKDDINMNFDPEDLVDIVLNTKL